MLKNKEFTGFTGGQILFTAGVADLIAGNTDFSKFVAQSLARHLKGDWGDVDAQDKMANDEAVKAGDRMLSAYNDDRFPRNGVATMWIITEADRSATTVLFPDEY
jgi:hypothetical protein